MKMYKYLNNKSLNKRHLESACPQLYKHLLKRNLIVEWALRSTDYFSYIGYVYDLISCDHPKFAYGLCPLCKI